MEDEHDYKVGDGDCKENFDDAEDEVIHSQRAEVGKLTAIQHS